MKATQLREHTDTELEQLLDETQRELFDLRARTVEGDGSTPPMKRRLLRRQAARIKTVMNERKQAGATASEGE